VAQQNPITISNQDEQIPVEYIQECTYIPQYMKRLYDRGLTTCLGGNISCKVGERIFITPSSIDKYCLSPCDIVELDCDGKKIAGSFNPSMEYRMHVEIYRRRKDIFAVVHSHPFFATLLSIVNKEINIKLTAESAKNVGVVGIAEYASMGSLELADIVSAVAIDHNVVLMKNHGLLTVGKDILDAFYRLEVTELTAKLTFYSQGLVPKELSQNDLENLFNISKANN
jgi:L-fuculose-phosphate aldolase